MIELKDIYIDNINEFIRCGDYDPSDYALSLVWMSLERKFGAGELLSDAINGDDLLSADILNWIKFKEPGDQGKRRVNQALCNYAKYFVDQDEDMIWGIWKEQCKPDPMDLAKQGGISNEYC